MILPSDNEHLGRINPGRILGIDYGEKRIGVALSDPLRITASPLETVPNSGAKTAAYIVELARHHRVSAVVFGKPLHMNGRAGDMCAKAETFAERIAADLSETPIFFWDERLSSFGAEKIMIETGRSPSRNREKIDRMAAAIILTGFLQRLDAHAR